MRLTMIGAPEIRASRTETWRRLMDPEFVAATAPGIESVERLDATHFKVVSGFGIGALKLRFTMRVELFDIVEGKSAALRARGKAPGSTVDATTSFRIEELNGHRVRLHWEAVTQVGGTIASVGARLLEGTARRLTEEFWRDFATRVEVAAAAG